MYLKLISLFLMIAFVASPVQGSWIETIVEQLESSCSCQASQSCCCEVDSENSLPNATAIKGAGCLCSETAQNNNSTKKINLLLSQFSIKQCLVIEDVVPFHALCKRKPCLYKIEKPPRLFYLS